MITTKDNVFDITLEENFNRREMLSRNQIPWYIRTIGNIERRVLRKFQNINPTAERIVRFYTYNNKNGVNFDFKCHSYTYDLINCLYDDFVKVSHEIGGIIQNTYGVAGKYYYDVKITLVYEKTMNHLKEEWDTRYIWKIVKTDNPKCIIDNPSKRKNCSYLSNSDSKLTIEGYKLNGNYKEITDVISELLNKIIVVHSTNDAKVLFKIVKFLGVKTVFFGNTYHPNDASSALFTKNTFSYKLDISDNQLVLIAISKSELPINCQDMIDIDEFIVRKSIRTLLKI